MRFSPARYQYSSASVLRLDDFGNDAYLIPCRDFRPTACLEIDR